MPNEPERLSALAPATFRETLRQALQATYGTWERAQGTALDTEAWFVVLADAVQAEARDWPMAVELCGFVLMKDDTLELTDWASAVLSCPSARQVLTTTLAALRPTDLATPNKAKAFFAGLRHDLRASDGLRGQAVMDTIRASLTGNMRGPCLGIVAALLGATRVRRRIEEQLACLQSS